MYTSVYFEISGVCNGDCPYCLTGKKCVIGQNQKDIKARGFVNPHKFAETIDHLVTEKAISAKETIIHLYNWGEPFLHPHINQVLQVLYDRHFHYVISTNASIPKPIQPHLLQNLDLVILSLSGFSQKSYNRIHGFNFEEIKSNIIAMVTSWREVGIPYYSA